MRTWSLLGPYTVPDHPRPRVRRRGCSCRTDIDFVSDGAASQPTQLVVAQVAASAGNLCDNWGAIGDPVNGAAAECVAVPAVTATTCPTYCPTPMPPSSNRCRAPCTPFTWRCPELTSPSSSWGGTMDLLTG